MLFVDQVRFQVQMGKHDGLIFIISSHGSTKNRIVCSDGNKLDLNDICSYFNGKNSLNSL